MILAILNYVSEPKESESSTWQQLPSVVSFSIVFASYRVSLMFPLLC